VLCCPSGVRFPAQSDRIVVTRIGARAAFRGGVWQTAVLLRLWHAHLEGLPGWQGHRYVGYRVVTADVTAFWRPALKNCPSKHYHPAANRALPAVIFGIVGEVGEIGGQRVACPRAFERVPPRPQRDPRVGGRWVTSAAAWQPTKSWQWMPASRSATCKPSGWAAM
jgi:hypothetical protein